MLKERWSIYIPNGNSWGALPHLRIHCSDEKGARKEFNKYSHFSDVHLMKEVLVESTKKTDE